MSNHQTNQIFQYNLDWETVKWAMALAQKSCRFTNGKRIFSEKRLCLFLQQVLFVLQLRGRKTNCLLKNFCIYQLTTFKASNKFSLAEWNYLKKITIKRGKSVWGFELLHINFSIESVISEGSFQKHQKYYNNHCIMIVGFRFVPFYNQAEWGLDNFLLFH